MKLLVLYIIIPIICMSHVMTTHHTIYSYSKVVKKDARKLAEYYRQRVMRGESMATIAKMYSEDPGSANNGGQYSNVVRGQMVPEFETVAFKLKPNEVSDVFETKYGFEFIQLISRKGDVLNLRHVLITRD